MDSSEDSSLKIETPHFKAVILHNVMSDWNKGDTEVSDKATKRMRRALIEQGYEVVVAPVRTDVAEPLHGLDPKEHVVFNWCEGIDGQPNAYEAVPPVLESMGFAYTGADAWTLATTIDKAITKEHLLKNIVPFFVEHPLKTKKNVDFRKFRQVLLMMEADEHLTRDGVEEIRSIAAQMNRGRSR